MKASTNAGLQSLALALIFMPEPFTTPIGLGLLVYTKMAQQQRPTVVRRRANTFSDIYGYKLNMVRSNTLTYELFPKRSGQMPKAYPAMATLQDNQEVLKALRQRPQQQSKSNVASSDHEPAGLMRGPKLPALAASQDNQQVLKALRQRSQQQSRSYIASSNLEPAGLMRGPRLKDRAAWATVRNNGGKTD